MSDQSTDAKAELARQLADLLFPPMERLPGGGWLDRGVDDLEGALLDIERQDGHADGPCLITIRRVTRRLKKARRLVEGVFGDRCQRQDGEGPAGG